jgi:hypothetical protein
VKRISRLRTLPRCTHVQCSSITASLQASLQVEQATQLRSSNEKLSRQLIDTLLESMPSKACLQAGVAAFCFSLPWVTGTGSKVVHTAVCTAAAPALQPSHDTCTHAMRTWPSSTQLYDLFAATCDVMLKLPLAVPSLPNTSRMCTRLAAAAHAQCHRLPRWIMCSTEMLASRMLLAGRSGSSSSTGCTPRRPMV